jgi:restriction system protein
MKALDAVYYILKKAGYPLSLKEITRLIFEEELIQSSGKTPLDSIGARIYIDIKKKGEQSKFLKLGHSVFSLREFTDNPMAEPVPSTKTASLPQPSSGLSFLEAAQKVLSEFADHKPMHYKKITSKAIEQGWIITQGKTTDSTLLAALHLDINKKKQQNQRPIFIQHGEGKFGLGIWEDYDLFDQIEGANRKVQEELLARLHNMTPTDFELLSSQLLLALGFEQVQVTKPSNDRGVDVRGTLVVGGVIRTNMAVQVKRWTSNVDRPIVQKIRGSLGVHEQGLIITTSDFTPGAVREASEKDRAPIGLMNGQQLITLLTEYQIGVKYENRNIFKIDEGLFTKDNGQDD